MDTRVCPMTSMPITPSVARPVSWASVLQRASPTCHMGGGQIGPCRCPLATGVTAYGRF
jgi:hypothetical protein